MPIFPRLQHKPERDWDLRMGNGEWRIETESEREIERAESKCTDTVLYLLPLLYKTRIERNYREKNRNPRKKVSRNHVNFHDLNVQ